MPEKQFDADVQLQSLVAAGLTNDHVARSIELVQAALKIVPVPPAVQVTPIRFSASAN